MKPLKKNKWPPTREMSLCVSILLMALHVSCKQPSSSSAGAGVKPPVKQVEEVQTPGIPSALSGTADNTQVTLRWTAPTTDNVAEISSYLIEYVPSGGAAVALPTGSTETVFTVTGLTNGLEYVFRVAASNSAGTGSYSEESVKLTPNLVCSNSVAADRPNDCYFEGSSPNYVQDLAIGTERQGPDNKTLTLQFANGTSGFKIWKEKGGNRILNASGQVIHGWQKQLTRPGTAFNATDFTAGSSIAGRVCPPNVFLSFENMTATGRCVYYDPSNGAQALDRDSGIVGEDRLVAWDNSASGRGVSASYYEGNIKTCADKGMRLPTIYETEANNPNYSGMPNGDSITPTFALENGVPSHNTEEYISSWTASAFVGDDPIDPTNNFFVWTWDMPVGGSRLHNQGEPDLSGIRCVLPNSVPID